MSAAGLLLHQNSVAAHHLRTLQDCERGVLSGKLKQVIVVTVDEAGRLSVHSTGPPPLALGFLEIAKASLLRSLEGPASPEGLAS